MREIDKRVKALEAVTARAEDAFLTVTRRDGSRRRMLWTNAMLLGDVAAVEGEGELAGLAKVFLMNEIQPKTGGFYGKEN